MIQKIVFIAQSAIEMNVNMFIINVDTRECPMFSINVNEALTVYKCIRWKVNQYLH